MKPKLNLAALACVAVVGVLLHVYGTDKPAPAPIEYATIRWAGKENTHIIRAGGEVEFIGPQLRQLRRPERADERSFYMNAAANGMIKEGYELAAFTADEIVMKRGQR